MKKGIPHGTRRSKVEEYIQLHNFHNFCKTHSEFDKLGDFGLLGRAASQVTLKDKGRHGDNCPNMLEAIKIVSRNPLPVPPGPPKKPPTGRPRGRPFSRRGHRRGQGVRRAACGLGVTVEAP